MSQSSSRQTYLAHYRKTWDELAAVDPEVRLDVVDDEFLRTLVIDIDVARRAACRDARKTIDKERTHKKASHQLALPTLADDDEYFVIGDGVRAKMAPGLRRHHLAALALSDEGLKILFDANHAAHNIYRQLDPYYDQGMTYNQAVAAWHRDHPNGATGTP